VPACAPETIGKQCAFAVGQCLRLYPEEFSIRCYFKKYFCTFAPRSSTRRSNSDLLTARGVKDADGFARTVAGEKRILFLTTDAFAKLLGDIPLDIEDAVG